MPATYLPPQVGSNIIVSQQNEDNNDITLGSGLKSWKPHLSTLKDAGFDASKWISVVNAHKKNGTTEKTWTIYVLLLWKTMMPKWWKHCSKGITLGSDYCS
ncbi:hypothetical protein JHK85_055882 [Glycine max]|nr:hypothetical protein JHK85_055882 [Glycine max]